MSQAAVGNVARSQGKGRMHAVLMLLVVALLTGCAAHYVAPSRSSSRTADVEFVFKGSSLTSSVSVVIGDCGSEQVLGNLRSGMLLRGDNRGIATVVDTSKPMAYRLELLGPVTGPFCTEHAAVALIPDRAYRIEVGAGERMCGTEVFERIDGQWQKPREAIFLACDR